VSGRESSDRHKLNDTDEYERLYQSLPYISDIERYPSPSGKRLPRKVNAPGIFFTLAAGYVEIGARPLKTTGALPYAGQRAVGCHLKLSDYSVREFDIGKDGMRIARHQVGNRVSLHARQLAPIKDAWGVVKALCDSYRDTKLIMIK
jgi:hypothetical protein